MCGGGYPLLVISYSTFLNDLLYQNIDSVFSFFYIIFVFW
jgi:hypothetical protein